MLTIKFLSAIIFRALSFSHGYSILFFRWKVAKSCYLDLLFVCIGYYYNNNNKVLSIYLSICIENNSFDGSGCLRPHRMELSMAFNIPPKQGWSAETPLQVIPLRAYLPFQLHSLVIPGILHIINVISTGFFISTCRAKDRHASGLGTADPCFTWIVARIHAQ